ncbi:STAS domain-containing protein [Thiopseudomonas acetoxidans]|uniref:STAS domain-containing protein n=1 Tax=Thiopseudomonas acetoxidans TaxID=3041622 RepID=A0ABT7SRZ3_9GAMM|nr:STAS domain-containing protein [Thiopseudomonas sp. CY1220]MDM7858973.1 STAS domain-containing protein [Thiopseudomonas sp. CY1220]
MSSGKIKFAEQDQTFVLKCIGEVRLNFCAVLNETIEQAIATGNSKAIIIDLTEVTSIDSTTLGLLAKLSILSRKSFGMLPTLASTNPDISQQLDAMGFAQVFNIVHTPAPCPECLNDLPDQPQSEEVVRERVLEAHRILMELNESNRTAFRDLVSILEETGQSC